MRPVAKLLLMSVLTFAAAFATRRTFFWDVRPVSWDYEPPQTGVLEMAYLLLSIENIAAVVGVIALVLLITLWINGSKQTDRQQVPR
jgi:hypothetical protein